MPWDATPNGGFTNGRPWLPLGDHATINVAAESRDPRSMLTLYQKLLALRHAHPALVGGTIDAIAWGDGVISYERRLGGKHLKVVLNLTSEARHADGIDARILVSTTLERDGEAVSGHLALAADEGLVHRARAIGAYRQRSVPFGIRVATWPVRRRHDPWFWPPKTQRPKALRWKLAPHPPSA